MSWLVVGKTQQGYNTRGWRRCKVVTDVSVGIVTQRLRALSLSTG